MTHDQWIYNRDIICRFHGFLFFFIKLNANRSILAPLKTPREYIKVHMTVSQLSTMLLPFTNLILHVIN